MMHQRRRPILRSNPTTRLAGGTLVAFAIVTAAIVVAGYCFPLCVLYTPDNPEWHLFACWACGT